MQNTPTIQLDITDIAYSGKGVGRTDGKVVFVNGAIRGEKVEAAIVNSRKNFAEAMIIRVVQPSPERVEPACPLALGRAPFAAHCPGCCYQHMTYEEEIRTKQSQFIGLLQRMAKIENPPCLPPVPSPKNLGYRNKISLHGSSSEPVNSTTEEGRARPSSLRSQSDLCFGGEAPGAPSVALISAGPSVPPCQTESQNISGQHTRALGYFSEDNRTVIDVESCPLAAPEINDALSKLRSDASFINSIRPHMLVTFRCSEKDGAFHWIGKGSPPGRWLTENTPVGPLSVPRGSFFQVNPPVADLVLEHVMEILKSTGCDSMIDLFCGNGIFALAAGKAGFSQCTGIDCDSDAVKAARFNAASMKLNKVNFIAGPARKEFEYLPKPSRPEKTVLLVDPPRTGLEKELIADIIKAGFSNIVYVSCSPDTLCRDLAIFKAGGYKVGSARLFDMFPRTQHFESVTWLSR